MRRKILPLCLNTINTLTNDERGTYNDRLDLLLKVTNPTNIESGKIKVYDYSGEREYQKDD